MRSIIKLGVFLLVVAGVAGLAISYVNGITSPIIEQQMIENKLASFKEVYPDSDEVRDETSKYLNDSTNPVITEVNVAYQGGSPAGVIYGVAPNGYAGKIQILAGFDIASQKITVIKILSLSETPGLGAKATEPAFTDRFKDKDAASPLEVVKQEPAAGNEILAITASTITSKAVTDGVNAAREHFTANFK
ncbi:MAG: FMN-binding protein [Clostridia bacterium]|jgi:electron transport complex protein RnfG|nr:FMN-binding protein [Clostridia bacterium]